MTGYWPHPISDKARFPVDGVQGFFRVLVRRCQQVLGIVFPNDSRPAGSKPPMLRDQKTGGIADQSQVLVSLDHVSLSYGDKTILKDVSFQVSRREVIALLGPSGSGKSTILKIIAGLLAPDKGKAAIQSEHIGMVFQDSALLSSLNVFDNISLPLKRFGNTCEADIESKVLKTLALVGLSDVGESYPDELSGGMRKRVSIARALIIEPDILLYDEPSAGLDPMTASKLEEDMRSITIKVGAAAVLVSHDIETISHMADRILIIHESKIVWEGERETFLTSQDPYPKQFRERRIEGPISV